MNIKIAIFEDDIDFAEALKEMLGRHLFKAVTCYTLADPEWHDVDIVVGDYRNRLVTFESLKRACCTEGVPLLAISGASMDYRPQLLKPFTTDQLKDGILASLILANDTKLVRMNRKSKTFLQTVSTWLKS